VFVPFSVRVNICCIVTEGEARLAIAHGAASLGFVSRMPSGPGVIPEQRIAEIVSTVLPGIATFLLTAETEARAIIEQVRRTRVNTLQLVDRLPPGTHDALRMALPGVGLLQVVHVVGPESIDQAMAVAPVVDAILLDLGNPTLAIKELGGTGRVHDWEISRQVRESINRPVFLAGGLRPDNVADAIRAVRPFGLDVCNGVRSDGNLDAAKLAAFFEAVENAGWDVPRAANS
jgi:phosphoribosylanthranilate isomerase